MPLAGERIDAIDVPPDAWINYTPVWASSGTQPVLGNGSISGSYYLENKIIRVRGILQLGTTSTVGTGNYYISTPVTYAASAFEPMFGAWLLDQSAGLHYSFFGQAQSGTQMSWRNAGNGIGQIWSATTPVVPANTDIFAWAVTLNAT